jgi:hypothetical protein
MVHADIMVKRQGIRYRRYIEKNEIGRVQVRGRDECLIWTAHGGSNFEGEVCSGFEVQLITCFATTVWSHERKLHVRSSCRQRSSGWLNIETSA